MVPFGDDTDDTTACAVGLYAVRTRHAVRERAVEDLRHDRSGAIAAKESRIISGRITVHDGKALQRTSPLQVACVDGVATGTGISCRVVLIQQRSRLTADEGHVRTARRADEKLLGEEVETRPRPGSGKSVRVPAGFHVNKAVIALCGLRHRGLNRLEG